MRERKEYIGQWALVQWFADEMMTKLFQNRHKGDTWQRVSNKQLLNRLRQETTELEKALTTGKGVVEECADVANFAMFIADNFSNEQQS